MDDRAVRTTILGTAVFVCVLLVAASPGRADDERQRQTLAGLKGLSIVVEDLSPEAEKDGLSGATLQADLEAKVRGAGISVLTDRAEGYNEPFNISITKFDGTTQTFSNSGMGQFSTLSTTTSCTV